MGYTPVLGWDWPELLDVADAPEGFAELAADIEAAFADKSLAQFIPRWVAAGEYQPTNPLISVGFFRYNRGLADMAIYQAYGPATSGGSGDLAFELPMWASWPEEQWMSAKAYIPGYGRALGLGLVNARQVVQPLFPVNAATTGLQRWRSTLEPIAVQTGIPQVTGQYTIQAGGTISITGRYRVAA